MQHEYGEIAVVKVGAMNVSSIQYVDPLPETLVIGDELAYLNLDLRLFYYWRIIPLLAGQISWSAVK